MRILLTNDDGIRAEGLKALRMGMESLGDLWVVAPDREQSATSHALTLSRPLRVHQHEDQVFSVDGTPTDCVLLAVKGIRNRLQPKPDLVVSGINHGPNMGDDVTYSGTVSAALEGRLLGCPSIAISVASWKPKHFDSAARVAQGLSRILLETGLPDRTFLNVNVPDIPYDEIKGVRVTKLGDRVYRDVIIDKVDPRGRPYYWIGGDDPDWKYDESSDFFAVQAGYVSVTPISLDRTDFRSVQEMGGWNFDAVFNGNNG
ncbi:MAG: 5'/3'-nucleotidase SurE [Candidatus Eisenbacteria bacterium]|uniref:5'-nucleotidase SurE n=1 Tax=Eiseniibacteriota bacterium TaxID=2212470 RepID=A0A948W6A1_UNCEI|nr:5'/3'-nucleotidase SurE [Candidatus Eisenbacteria bacterium]MBU1948409.1 5'/3'-nucleotidase SurE [Candidatus Eisenbacteria bacterium]MBU2691299.1 5'/3'-nucleotidase SurE [Candidatus Eisenbacteria bacterium]